VGKSGDCCYNNQNPPTDRRMSKSKLTADYHEVLCVPCEAKEPGTIKMASFMIPVRENPYDMEPGTAEIDKRLMGACLECIEGKNKFQRAKPLPVDPENTHLVYELDNV